MLMLHADWATIVVKIDCKTVLHQKCGHYVLCLLAKLFMRKSMLFVIFFEVIVHDAGYHCQLLLILYSAATKSTSIDAAGMHGKHLQANVTAVKFFYQILRKKPSAMVKFFKTVWYTVHF